MNLKKLLLAPLALLGVQAVHAHCPLCTGAAIGGVALARVFGVDDSISGIFIGALIVSTALWFSKIAKKKINFPLQDAAFVAASFALTVIPFYAAGLITAFDMVKSMPAHHAILGLGVFGIDKLLTGILFGTFGIWFALWLSNAIKEDRGKSLWPFQGVSFVVIASVAMSLIFWGITSWI
jgi:hypothetical protein